MSTRDLKSNDRLDPTDEWLDRTLDLEQYCQMATISTTGPHVTPMAFVWVNAAAWINCQTRTQRWVDVQRDPRVSLVVEMTDSREARYVEIMGDAVIASSVPSLPAETPELAIVEQRFTEKYGVPLAIIHDGLHAWLRIVPRKILRITSTIAHRKTEIHLAEAIAAQEQGAIHWAVD